jgi:hypothetical protein
MWGPPIRARGRRTASPPYYGGYDLDLYRYSNCDAVAAVPAVYPYGYGIGNYPFALGEYSGAPATTLQLIEQATRDHAAAQAEMDKAKEKFDEAKQADERLRQAKNGYPA